MLEKQLREYECFLIADNYTIDLMNTAFLGTLPPAILQNSNSVLHSARENDVQYKYRKVGE